MSIPNDGYPKVSQTSEMEPIVTEDLDDVLMWLTDF